MSRLLVIPFCCALALPASAAEPTSTPPALKYPDAKRDATVDTLHGTKVADPYRWLEDASQPAVQAWMNAEDKLGRDYVARLPVRDRLAARMKELFYVDHVFPPVRRGTRLFYLQQTRDQEKPVLYVRDSERAPERTLIDPNTLATTTLGDWMPTHDGKKLAYILHVNNSDAGVLHVLDVASGKPLPDEIAGADYTEISWTPGGDGFYYTWLPSRAGKASDADRFALAEARFHKLGTPVASDVRVHAAPGDARVFVGATISDDGHWLTYVVQHGEVRTDVYYRDLRKPNDDWHALTSGLDARYDVEAYGDRFYIHTNEGASRWRLLVADAKKPGRADWRELVPERKEVVIESAAVRGKQLLLVGMQNAVHVLEIHRLDGTLLRSLALPALGQVDMVHGAQGSDDLYLRFVSFTSPPRVLHASIAKGGLEAWGKPTAFPVDLSGYVTEQVFFPSKDGTRLSMFLVHKKDRAAAAERSSLAPTLLYGYGGFNVAALPAWRPELIPWLEAGGVYASANLRGGGEYGEDWHRAGMGQHKQNVFDDFTAAAQWLLTNHWTTTEQLAIWGRSNGGLLVGALTVQHPEMFRAVLCGVPLLDMVRFHLFGGGKTWTPEYGTPEDAADFRALYAYSPYHHVRPGVRYPALLMLSADADDRVEPLHARKFVAALQYAQAGVAGARPVIMRIEKHSGHAGSDRPAYNSQLVGYWADAFAFLFHELDLK
jgi:prolyl oligopeptidase